VQGNAPASPGIHGAGPHDLETPVEQQTVDGTVARRENAPRPDSGELHDHQEPTG